MILFNYASKGLKTSKLIINIAIVLFEEIERYVCSLIRYFFATIILFLISLLIVIHLIF